MKVLFTKQDSDMVIDVSVVQVQKRLGNTKKNDYLTKFADGGWDKLHAPNRFIDEAKEWRRRWHAFQKRARKSSHAREDDFGAQSTLFVSN